MVEARAGDRTGGVSLAARAVLLRCPRWRQRGLDRRSQAVDVWEVPNVHRTRGTSDDMITDHGTQKPVEVMARPIRNHTGDVYEPFSGSGSTLIAAEQLGRRCYAMEIEPKYVQMAIERWQAYTGGHAERI